MRFSLKIRRIVLLAGSAIAGTGALAAFGLSPAADEKQPDAAAVEFFETKVRPVLANNCFSCHGEKQQQSGIRLDSMVSMLKGNSGGPAISPGNPEKSPLVHVIRYDGKIKMPPSGKLKTEEIAALTEWVKMGAPWPGVKVSDAAAQAAKSGEFTITQEHRKFWSFRPVVKPALPSVKNRAWVQTPIDSFILARLEKKGLAPSPRADKRTLIRRATFDLTGLPPTPGEIDAFLADNTTSAFAKVVDRLLASPRYGERWGRLWLDVARYADTKGYVFEEDRNYYNAYTYRDYVIRAFNEDLPYDRFILHQLAADRLDLGEDKRPLAALGFLTVGRRFLNAQPDIIDDRIDVTMRGFQGLTVNCARCHDHKFDPIPTKDYYSLYGIFASSIEPNPPPAISPKEISEPYEKHNAKLREAEGSYMNTIMQQIRVLRDKVNSAPDTVDGSVKGVLQALRLGQKPRDEQIPKLEPAFSEEAKKQVKDLRAQIATLKSSIPPPPEFAMAMQDAPNPVEPVVFVRGNQNNRGPQVPRQFLAVLSSEERKPFTQGSGRLELAKSIASADNPLTARVMVNRMWRHHFGAGLVRTPSDFGTRGEPPTHPELLDWLAAEFTSPVSSSQFAGLKTDTAHPNPKPVPTDPYACGWSIKKLHRMIMLSSAYQQASDVNPKSFAADPENRLVWKYNRHRLDLEQLRDSVLFAANRLDTTIGGKAVNIVDAPYSTRRTVYGQIDRQNLPGLFRTFDFASPDASNPQRFSTTVPQQALFMMNSPFLVEQAKALAKRAEFAGCKDDADRVRTVYRILFGRMPTQGETQAGIDYLQQGHIGTATAQAGQTGSSALTLWERYVQALLMTNEFSFVD